MIDEIMTNSQMMEEKIIMSSYSDSSKILLSKLQRRQSETTQFLELLLSSSASRASKRSRSSTKGLELLSTTCDAMSKIYERKAKVFSTSLINIATTASNGGSSSSSITSIGSTGTSTSNSIAITSEKYYKNIDNTRSSTTNSLSDKSCCSSEVQKESLLSSIVSSSLSGKSSFNYYSHHLKNGGKRDYKVESNKLYITDDRPHVMDIICVERFNLNDHPGNLRLLDVVKKISIMHHSINIVHLSRAIVEYVCKYGGRFIKKDFDGRCFLLREEDAKKKVSSALRNERAKSKRNLISNKMQ